MKASPHFKTAIQKHLDGLAANDELFAETLEKPNKNIDDCITYIFNQVKASGCNGFADGEIFGMAVHYYDEDDINVGKPINGKVVVNHTTTNKLKEKSTHNEKVEEPFGSKITTKTAKIVKLQPVNQVSLFDFPGV